jgi:hypothetical protein
MVSGYDDPGQEVCPRRGHRGGSLVAHFSTARTVVVEEERHTAEHIVIATGTEPGIPAVPGLRELDGV